MKDDDYKKAFHPSGSQENEHKQCKLKKENKLYNAFEKAHDIRKFEIELYWKRTAYFWTLIAAIFAGYFLLLATEESKIPHKELYLMAISSIGLVFSYAWFLAAKGSKFWQENWECHLDMLEDDITGPLYKTVLKRENKDDEITSPEAFSVSKINQWIAMFVIIIWSVFTSLPLITRLADYLKLLPSTTSKKECIITITELIILILTIIFTYAMSKYTKTEFWAKNSPSKIKSIERKTTLN
ncbi:hypothetical protein SME17J_22140 [Serratia marcescens]|nr:hypothetical protein SME17J_22140 [Serratia marcescens]